MEQEGEEEDEEEEEASNIDDYGRWKMKKFKDFARDVLLIQPTNRQRQQHQDAWAPSPHHEEHHHPDLPARSDSQQQRESIQPFLYDLHQQSDLFKPTVDINGDVLYAYKELKKIMTKN